METDKPQSVKYWAFSLDAAEGLKSPLPSREEFQKLQALVDTVIDEAGRDKSVGQAVNWANLYGIVGYHFYLEFGEAFVGQWTVEVSEVSPGDTFGSWIWTELGKHGYSCDVRCEW